MNMKRHIHTTIDESLYKRLMKMGDNQLNAGIAKAVAIADGRELEVKSILTDIARRVLNTATDMGCR